MSSGRGSKRPGAPAHVLEIICCLFDHDIPRPAYIKLRQKIGLAVYVRAFRANDGHSADHLHEMTSMRGISTGVLHYPDGMDPGDVMKSGERSRWRLPFGQAMISLWSAT